MENQDLKQKEIKAKLEKGVEKEFVQRNFPLYQGVLLKGGAGSIMGYCAGRFAK